MVREDHTLSSICDLSKMGGSVAFNTFNSSRIDIQTTINIFGYTLTTIVNGYKIRSSAYLTSYTRNIYFYAPDKFTFLNTS